MKYTVIVLFVFFTLLTHQSISQSSYGKKVTYYFGAQYSEDYNMLQLVDDPHSSIDSSFHLGLSDADYINLR